MISIISVNQTYKYTIELARKRPTRKLFNNVIVFTIPE